MFGSTILDIATAISMQIEKFRDSVFQITLMPRSRQLPQQHDFGAPRMSDVLLGILDKKPKIV
jgi:hypothetical protein